MLFCNIITWEWFLCRWGKLFSSVRMTHSPAGRALRVDQPHATRRGRGKKKSGDGTEAQNWGKLCQLSIVVYEYVYIYIFIYTFEHIHIDTVLFIFMYLERFSKIHIHTYRLRLANFFFVLFMFFQFHRLTTCTVQVHTVQNIFWFHPYCGNMFCLSVLMALAQCSF